MLKSTYNLTDGSTLELTVRADHAHYRLSATLDTHESNSAPPDGGLLANYLDTAGISVLGLARTGTNNCFYGESFHYTPSDARDKATKILSGVRVCIDTALTSRAGRIGMLAKILPPATK